MYALYVEELMIHSRIIRKLIKVEIRLRFLSIPPTADSKKNLGIAVEEEDVAYRQSFSVL